MAAERFSIGEVATRTGLSVDTLRWFERERLLLRSVSRTSGGRRVYDTADLEWLHLINRLRTSGMPIARIREFAGLVRSGPGNEAERLAVLVEHEQAVQVRIAELAEHLAVIQEKVRIYGEHVLAGTAAGLWAPVAGND
ncbi:MerR family transcriptional regulator [Parafrankia sp. FMc2]|uniref:MerR family transcriptional regulator n=1 Tax=Parafrankia sp. FMc2 TaxID=3233196 RepID=UPI0034D41D05